MQDQVQLAVDFDEYRLSSKKHGKETPLPVVVCGPFIDVCGGLVYVVLVLSIEHEQKMKYLYCYKQNKEFLKKKDDTYVTSLSDQHSIPEH